MRNAILRNQDWGFGKASGILVPRAHDHSNLRQGSRTLASNLVPRDFSSTIFKMADSRERTLGKAGSRGTKSPKSWRFLSRDILRSPEQNGG